ncbi:hypothetical protein EY915_13335 [Citrobacter braakii]|uniref:winged helix-turn-helix domain-containing protein n=1 Tax=Citrobacter braakii TaxID=57706 RepID=UPI001039D8D5|nr:winged helix-turn-helix domain-containing protein [Citrobacter braakii]TCC80859.1 hypothetical protein EY915_13335 [Citrobacter braakii]
MVTVDDCNDSDLNLDNKNVYLKGEMIALRAKEKCLLEILLNTSPACISRQKIAEEVWNGRFVSDFTINQTINSLRRKIKDNDRQLIKTKPREGYVIDKDIAALFTFDSDIGPTCEPEDLASSEANALIVITDHSVKHEMLNNHKKSIRAGKKLSLRVIVLMSLLLACSMAGVGVGVIREYSKDEINQFYLDGVKFTFHKERIDYQLNKRNVNCHLVRRTLDDGEIVDTNTTLCNTSL